MIKVKIKKLISEAKIPKYAKSGDMGMDLYATGVEYDSKNDLFIYHTGLSFEIPEGYGMLIFPRSSNRKTNVYLTNSVGIIDSGYRGEVLICYKSRTSIEIANLIYELSSKEVHNPSETLGKDRVQPPYNIGDRIAQAVILPYPQIEFEEGELTDSERGDGGFGSTGK